MSQPVLISKYGQIVDILRRSLEDGTYKEGGRLPSENELSTRYGISRNTVREAISSLVQQGLLTRTQGKGTFVTGVKPRGRVSDSYAIFLHAQSHVFEAETRLLVRAFQQAGAMPIVFDVGEHMGESQIDGIIRKLLDQQVAGIVIEESLVPAFRRIAGRHSLPPLALVNFGSEEADLRLQCVFSDFEEGVRLGARHLLDLGRRRLLFVIHRNRYAEPGFDLGTIKGIYGDAIRGFRSAVAGAGPDAAGDFFFVDHEFREPGDRDRLKALLAGPDRPDAVFAFSDFRAKQVIDIAVESGLRVPEDLAVVGYWNTPWAEMTRVPLTSVSIEEGEIARVASGKLLEARRKGEWAFEKVVIKPRLVVRQSCGAGLTASF